MKEQCLYFSDGFFSTGKKDIFTEDKQIVGVIDLKSAFTSTIDILNLQGETLLSGKFPLFSNKWTITDRNGKELGFVRSRFSFFSKKYEYTAHSKGIYRIIAEPFSKTFEIIDEQNNVIGRFLKINGFFNAPAFEMKQLREDLDLNEMVVIVMGVNAIQKRSHTGAKDPVYSD